VFQLIIVQDILLIQNFHCIDFSSVLLSHLQNL
jgi:hypothetical protein